MARWFGSQMWVTSAKSWEDLRPLWRYHKETQIKYKIIFLNI